MSDTERVRAWRDRLKQGGRVPMTLWVTAATKARYEDLALTYRRSPSELAQQALDAYRPDAFVSAIVADTGPLREIILAELAQFMTAVTSTVTDTVTATVTAQLQSLVQAAMSGLVSATVTETETVVAQRDTAPAPVTETAPSPAAAPARRPGRPSSALRQRILTLLASHGEGLSADEIRVYLKPDKPIGDMLQGMRKAGVLRTRGAGKTLRYINA